MISAGWTPVIVDNLSNSPALVLDRIESITGRRPAFVEADIRDIGAMTRLFGRHSFDAVVHFAGLKAVGESVEKPLLYYDNNVHGTLVLLERMREHGVHKLIFSSSATVYGAAARMPLTEATPVAPTSPYGRTKLMIEQIVRDLASADPQWQTILLRYFNPVGAHPSGLIGEDPVGIPNNLMPYVSQVAVGRREKLSVFGGDYATPDGTGVRDYIHVVDLAQGHLAALGHLMRGAVGETLAINLGTGRGHSVLEVVTAFERASGRRIPYEIVGRRPGDVATCYADVARAREVLGWTAQRGLDAMCADAWRWQSANPAGLRA
jgi:UDP-glucose 4-epimerase